MLYSYYPCQTVECENVGQVIACSASESRGMVLCKDCMDKDLQNGVPEDVVFIALESFIGRNSSPSYSMIDVSFSSRSLGH